MAEENNTTAMENPENAVAGAVAHNSMNDGDALEYLPLDALSFVKPFTSISSKSKKKEVVPIRDIHEKKNKLRTSKDVYDRLKWASGSTNIDVSSVYIGYLDRFLGICEIPFIEYNPAESDIPYHRIYYFRSGGPPVCPVVGDKGEICVKESNWPEGSMLVWDRHSRIDLVFNSGETLNSSAPSSSPKQVKQKEIPNYIKAPDNYEVVPCYKYNQNLQRWESVNFNSSPDHHVKSKTHLKMISFNILFDIYDPAIVQCNTRWPYLIDFLEETDADLIALQEVTTSFLSLLQVQPWCQTKYYLTDIAEKSHTIQPYGQILLSKFPPALVCLSKYTKEKRWMFASFLLNNQILHIPVIHLKSDHKYADNSDRRRRQILDVISACSIASSSTAGVPTTTVIVGDTNFKNEEYVDELSSQFSDVWVLLNDEAVDGFTVDVLNNPIAKQLSTRRQCSRFDRIFVNSNSTLLKPTSIKVVGKELIDITAPARCLNQRSTFLPECLDPLPLSDHYGLECVFELMSSPSASVGPSIQVSNAQMNNQSNNPSVSVQEVVYTSSVVMIPPEDLWDPIQKIRSEFDPSYLRWMPHINLLYGFIPDSGLNFAEAEKILSAGLKSFQPFSCKLSDLAVFKHGKSSCTIYLAPNASDKFKELQKALHAQYPFCSEQSSKSEDGFTPHLKVAKLFIGKGQDESFVHNRLAEWKEEILGKEFLGKEFTIDRVHLISRTKDSPFKIQKTVYFGSATETSDSEHPSVSITMRDRNDDTPVQDFLQSHNLLPTSIREQLKTQVFQELEKTCNIILNSASHGKPDYNWESVHLIGSGAIGCHTDHSDIDALCCGFEELLHEQFFEKLKLTISEGQSQLKLHHVVLDTLVPIAKLSMNDIEIDLVYSSCSSPWNLNSKQLKLLTDMNIRSVAGVRDAMELNKIIPDTWKNNYQLAVRAIKYWAKIRNIYSKGFGYLGGYPLCLLMAYVVQTMSSKDSTDVDPDILVSTPEQLITEFFYQFGNWKWPTPVQFHVSTSGKPKKYQPSNIPELMPILAPAYPFNNAARNVTKSTRSLLRKEFKRGHELLSQKSNNFAHNWNLVIGKPSFFKMYPNYLHIQLRSSSLESSNICNGFLESKLVGLLVVLEKEHFAFVQPYTKVESVLTSSAGEDPNVVDSSCLLNSFIGLDIKNTSNISSAIEYFTKKFDHWKFKPSDSSISITHLRTDDDNDCDILNQYRENEVSR